MTRIFGVDVAKLLRQGINAAGGLATNRDGTPAPAFLIKVVPGTRNPADLGAGTAPTTISYSCQAFVDDTELLSQGQTETDGVIRKSRRTITILGDSLPVTVTPADNDRITLRGVTYVVVAVKDDPADAAFECTVRGAGA